MSAYWDAGFFSFFATFFSRLFQGFPGGLASDELQLFTLGAVAISCGVVGPFLVLKRMAMFANALSHTVLFGIVGAYLLARLLWGGGLFDGTTLFLGAAIAALLTAVAIEVLTRAFRLQEEASVGLVFSVFFALGVVLVTVYTRSIHLGVEVVLGNADVLAPQDALRALGLAALNTVVVWLFYPRLQVCSFDRAFAASALIGQGKYHFLLLALSALTVLSAFRAVGVLLVLAFLVIPYLTVRLFCARLGWLLVLAPCLGIIESALGVALSRYFLTAFDLPLSTGGLTVFLMGLFYIAARGGSEIRFTTRKQSLLEHTERGAQISKN